MYLYMNIALLVDVGEDEEGDPLLLPLPLPPLPVHALTGVHVAQHNTEEHRA